MVKIMTEYLRKIFLLCQNESEHKNKL
jgi:hypothetical protein